MSLRQIVIETGLYEFVECLRGLIKLPKSKGLTFALAEHWWDVTHTFHFFWGEATVTPSDYAAITGLSFKGRSIKWRDGYTDKELQDLLGFVPSPKKGMGMEYAVIHGKIVESIARYEGGDERISAEQVARSFLWFAFLSTLFGHAEGTAMFALLRTLTEVERAGEVAWGEAWLAELYFALDRYSRKAVSSLTCFEFPLEV